MKRNKFGLSHYKLATMDMGNLIPLAWFEALPGDTIQQATSALIRCSPLVAPVMHPCLVRIHHWFVPNRLIWDNFEDFITGGDDGQDATAHPYIDASSVTEGSLADYLGVPVGSYTPDLRFSALPFRAYNLIYNEHYRDEDLITELTVDTGDGADTTTDTDVQRVAWGKDYFTTSRPWEQKGAQVLIPLGDAAPVTGIGIPNQNFPLSSVNVYESGGTNPTYAGARSMSNEANADKTAYIEEDPDNAGYPGVYADLSAATGIPVNDLRLALAIQRYQEARAIYGSRYVEYLRYLGVRGSDSRLQSPEFLGGGKNTIQFSEVLQTAEGTDPVGSLKGHGIAALRSNRYRRFFEEHGIVMTLASVIPKTIYAQGLHKKWSRTVKEDYFQRELQMIGEDEVYNKEVYAAHSAPDEIFAYQARYDEYRSHPSQVSGEFLSTLDHWHLARIFASDPALNQSFIECNPTKRVFASTNTDCLYVMANHSIQARRMIAKRAYNRII